MRKSVFTETQIMVILDEGKRDVTCRYGFQRFRIDAHGGVSTIFVALGGSKKTVHRIGIDKQDTRQESSSRPLVVKEPKDTEREAKHQTREGRGQQTGSTPSSHHGPLHDSTTSYCSLPEIDSLADTGSSAFVRPRIRLPKGITIAPNAKAPDVTP